MQSVQVEDQNGRLDKYSPIFVPAWLKQVANASDLIQFAAPVDSYPDPSLYIAGHFPQRLIEQLDQDVQSYHGYTSHCLLAAKHGQAPLHIPPLTPVTYAARFLPLMLTEHQATLALTDDATLYGANLKRLQTNELPPGLQGAYYSFEAKSVREEIRQVCFNSSGFSCLTDDLRQLVILKQLRWQTLQPQGTCFHARIHLIRRALGIVIVRCDALPSFEESMSFVVQWSVPVQRFEAIHYGVDAISRALELDPAGTHVDGHSSTDSRAATPSPFQQPTPLPPPNYATDGHLTRSWIFPDPEHVASVSREAVQQDLAWKEQDLNTEQKSAVRSIVFGQRRVPYLISGPFGTGKTKTLVETILQIVATMPQAHVLVCGASNPSADTIARRLIRSGMDRSMLLRFNDPSRSPDEISDHLITYCSFSEPSRSFFIPDASHLLSHRVVVCSIADSFLLYKYHLSNASLQALCATSLSLVDATYKDQLAEPHWTHLLIDEAAQAHEPESLLPLAVMLPLLPGTKRPSRTVPQIVLAGDNMQLGPQIISDVARSMDLDCSLFGRLLERPLYAQAPEARINMKKAVNGKSLNKDPNQILVNLIRNYRCHPGILCGPSLMFYEDTLRPAVADSVLHSPLLTWPKLARKGFPVTLVGIQTPEEWVDEGSSFYNLGEVDIVVEHVQDLVHYARFNLGNTSHVLKPSQISVITPFREQVWRIRERLRRIGLGDVDVGNVEALQGAENRVVIISCVRSTARFLENDRKMSRGLYMEPRRLCVALTRAKELLVVIGNPKIFEHDPWFKTFLDFCERQQCVLGTHPIGVPASTLERTSVLENDREYSSVFIEREEGLAAQLVKLAMS